MTVLAQTRTGEIVEVRPGDSIIASWAVRARCWAYIDSDDPEHRGSCNERIDPSSDIGLCSEHLEGMRT